MSFQVIFLLILTLNYVHLSHHINPTFASLRVLVNEKALDEGRQTVFRRYLDRLRHVRSFDPKSAPRMGPAYMTDSIRP